MPQDHRATTGLRLEQLRVLPYPAALFFCSWPRACQHICDHLLTEPEARRWALLLPDGHELLCVNRDTDRYKLAKGFWKEDNNGASAQPLYDEWLVLCRGEISAGYAAGRAWTEGHVRAIFGPRGVLAYVNKRDLVTAFLPGGGSTLASKLATMHAHKAEAGLDDQKLVQARWKNPLPRQHAPQAQGDDVVGMGMRRRRPSTESDKELERLRMLLQSKKIVSAALLEAFYLGEGDVEKPLDGWWDENQSSSEDSDSEDAQP